MTLHVREAVEKIEHAAIIGEHVGTEPSDAASRGSFEQLMEEDRAEAAACHPSRTTNATSAVAGSFVGS
jgi:hypothetical protein